MPDEIHFQWQNQFLLQTIYPMRATKLRDFLIYFQEIDLWAEYQAKSEAEIEAAAQIYRAAQVARWEEANEQYWSLRQYFLTPDVSAIYQAQYPDAESEVLGKINALHNLFARYFPKIKTFRNEGFFIATYLAEWETSRKAFLASISQKQRRIDVRRPDWPERPRVEHEIQQMKESGLPMADQELDQLYAFQQAHTRLVKERGEIDKQKAVLNRQRQELAGQLGSAQANVKLFKTRAETAAQQLDQVNQDIDIPAREAYFRQLDCTNHYASQFPAPDADTIQTFNRVHQILAPFLSPERTVAVKSNQVRLQLPILENLHHWVKQRADSIQFRLQVGGPDWPYREEKEQELRQLTEVKLVMCAQELGLLNGLLNAYTNLLRPAGEMEKLIAERGAAYASSQARYESANQEYLRLKNICDNLDQALNLPESELVQSLIAQRKITRQDITRGEIETYQKACSAKDESELLEEVVARFMAAPARYPLWLQYMVVHFSGMRYQSAHGSWANPIDLLISLSVKDIDQEIRRLDDVTIGIICEQRLMCYQEENSRSVELSELILKPALAQAADNYWKERIAMHLKSLASSSPYRQRKALVELMVDEKTYEMDQLTVGQAEQRLADMRSELPEWMWKEIVRLTSLKLNEINTADWENSSAIELAERNAYQYNSYRQLLDDWKQEFLTGWREEHDRSNRLIVTRAVCNEVAEHIQHLRGHTPGAGLTNKPLWYQRLERDPKQAANIEPPYFVRASQAEEFKVGASILWLNFVRKMPSPWQIANPVRLKSGEGLLPESILRGGKYRRDSSGHVLRTYEYTDEDGKKKSIEQWMRWLHEATVAVVAETADGTTVLTFETALPSEPRSRSAIGVFKHAIDWLFYRVDDWVFNGVYIGFAPPAELPIADLKEMLDWNKILRRPAFSPAEIEAYWEQAIPPNLKPPEDMNRPVL